MLAESGRPASAAQVPLAVTLKAFVLSVACGGFVDERAAAAPSFSSSHALFVARGGACYGVGHNRYGQLQGGNQTALLPSRRSFFVSTVGS